MFRHRRLLIICFLICNFLIAGQSAFADHSNFQTPQNFAADKFLRTELYFGTDKAGGGKVAAEDWDKFLESEVTPRFPDGFTVLEGYGQFRDASGKIVREASKVLVFFYPKKERGAFNRKIEELRALYKKQFDQQSVLRFDYLRSLAVSF
jgi:hypothetical protein